MRTLQTLTYKDEGILNNLLRNKKKESFVILYHSEWDVYSNKIVDIAKKHWVTAEGDERCFVVSSWQLPHAFAAFAITCAPCVVEVKKGKVFVHTEYPTVHDYVMNLRGKRKKRG